MITSVCSAVSITLDAWVITSVCIAVVSVIAGVMSATVIVSVSVIIGDTVHPHLSEPLRPRKKFFCSDK